MDLVTKLEKEIVTWLFMVISALGGACVFLFWRMFNGMEKKIDEKVNKETCDTLHDEVKDKLHKHAEAGHAGEVVK